jgi:predicted RNase H-like nuclease (RuvC/YqgF family)
MAYLRECQQTFLRLSHQAHAEEKGPNDQEDEEQAPEEEVAEEENNNEINALQEQVAVLESRVQSLSEVNEELRGRVAQLGMFFSRVLIDT